MNVNNFQRFRKDIFEHDKVTVVNVCFDLLWGTFSVHVESLCINEELTTSTSIQKSEKKTTFISRKCVNMYVNHIVFTVLLMVFRQWMILLILKLNYCTLLKVYPV